MSRVLLSDIAYTKIKERLLNGDVKESISESELVKILNMSRTPIREALNRLVNEDFIKVYPNRGIFIKEVSIKETNDLMDVRLAIETFAVMNIADKIEDADIDFLEENVIKHRKARLSGDAFQSIHLDLEYHKRILEILGNDYIIKVFTNLTDRLYLHGLKRMRSRGLENLQSVHDHMAINNALRDKDFVKAKDILAEHIINGKEDYFQYQ